MSPQFQVLRCFSCKTFQVQQVKKSRRWNCKMCGEKQSVVKVYGQGSGADCRHHVQKLNLLQGETGQAVDSALWSGEGVGEPEVDVSVCDGTDWHCDEAKRPQESERAGGSRWSKYLEKTQEEDDDDVDEEETWIGASVVQQGWAGTRNHTVGRSKRKRGGAQDGPRQKQPKAAGSEPDWGSEPGRGTSWAAVGQRSREVDSQPAAQPDVAQGSRAQASRWDRFLPCAAGDSSRGADRKHSASTELPTSHFTSKQDERDCSDLIRGPGHAEASLVPVSQFRYLPISDRVKGRSFAQPLSVAASKAEEEPDMGLHWTGGTLSSKALCDEAAGQEPTAFPLQSYPVWAHSPEGGTHTLSLKPLHPATPRDLSPRSPPTINSQNPVPDSRFPGSFLSLFHTDEDFDDL